MAYQFKFVNRDSIGGGMSRALGSRQIDPRLWQTIQSFRSREEVLVTLPRKVVEFQLPPSPTSFPSVGLTVTLLTGRMFMQSPDSTYWEMIVNSVTMKMDMVKLLTLPVGTIAETHNWRFVNQLQIFAFPASAGLIHRLWADQEHKGWHLTNEVDGYDILYTDNVYFSYASGFNLEFVDSHHNIWHGRASNIGQFCVDTL
jgi:hypothetical protein